MSETTNEETEPEGASTQAPEEYDNPGIAGQIQYPEPEVDAEHAAAYAAGLEDTLYPEGDPRNEQPGWTNPADRSSELVDEEGNPVDESAAHHDGE